MIAWGTFAQSSPKKGQSKNSPTTLDPKKPANFHAPHKKKTTKTLSYDALSQYAKRIEKVQQKSKHQELSSAQIQKDGREKPRFGHRRNPKIRKPGKQKFCKVCGIYH